MVIPTKIPSVILNFFLVILNLFQDNEIALPVILKQVQDDEAALFRMTRRCSSG